MNIKLYKFIIIGVLIVFALGAGASDHLINTSGTQGVDFTIQDLASRITFLACWLSGVSITVVVIAILFYGMMIMASGGDQAKYDNAKKSLVWAIVGAFVIIGTYVIIATVANAVGVVDISFIPLAC